MNYTTGVAGVLVERFASRGVPAHVHIDNGGNPIAKTRRRPATLAGVEHLYTSPGSPWQNGVAKSRHGRLREELLDAGVFKDVHDVEALAESCRKEQHHRRPHSSLKYVPTAQYAARLAAKEAMPPVEAPPFPPACPASIITHWSI